MLRGCYEKSAVLPRQSLVRMYASASSAESPVLIESACGGRRPDAKKQFDADVFGTKYF